MKITRSYVVSIISNVKWENKETLMCRVSKNVVVKKHFEIPSKDSILQEIRKYKRNVAID
jgi:hypothetical protein